MKTPRIAAAIGHIDDELIIGATRAKVVKKNPWLKWGAMAACLCIVAVAALVAPKMISQFAKTKWDDYGNTVAYVGWSDDSTIENGALNKDLLQNEPDTHLPIFKMDTLEDLEQFRSKYESVFSLDRGYDSALSFEGAIAKAQWDREIFFEEHSLLVIYVPSSSSAYRFGVQSVAVKDGSMCVSVEQKNDPEVATEDPAGWFILVEVEDEELRDCTSFDAILITE